jgi:hypothetical protein
MIKQGSNDRGQGACDGVRGGICSTALGEPDADVPNHAISQGSDLCAASIREARS